MFAENQSRPSNQIKTNQNRQQKNFARSLFWNRWNIKRRRRRQMSEAINHITLSLCFFMKREDNEEAKKDVPAEEPMTKQDDQNGTNGQVVQTAVPEEVAES